MLTPLDPDVIRERVQALPIVHALTRNPPPVAPGPVRPCASCRRFTDVTPEQVRSAFGPYAHLPTARTGLASDTRIGYCPVQHELRGEDTGCEFWSGRVIGRFVAWGRRRLRMPDLDAQLAPWIARRREAAERERLEARGAAARNAVPDPVCPVCKREHPQCAVCRHKRPTCGVCPTCGLEGVVVTTRADGGASWYCSRAPEHSGIGLPENPPYAGGVCSGCVEQRQAAADLADWLDTRAVGGHFSLADAMKASPVLATKDVVTGLARLVQSGDFRRGAGVNVMGVGVAYYPEELVEKALDAKARRRAFRHANPGQPDVDPGEILEFYARVR